MDWEVQEIFFAALSNCRLSALLCRFCTGSCACMWFYAWKCTLLFSQALHKLLNEQPVTFFPGSKPCEFPAEIEPGSHGAAAPTTHFCSVPFGLAMNCPSSMCFWETLPKTPNNYLCQVLSVHNRQLWKQPRLFKPPQKQSKYKGFPAKQTHLGRRNLTDRGKHAQISCSFWGRILLLARKLFWFTSEQVCSAPRPKQLWPPFTSEQL